jgi:hypothetical protein
MSDPEQLEQSEARPFARPMVRGLRYAPDGRKSLPIPITAGHIRMPASL